MPIICPTILAPNEKDYETQLKRIAGFAKRIQIDLTDGEFAASTTIEPSRIWWPAGVQADIHLMFRDPLAAVKECLNHQPNLIIIHSESNYNLDEIYSLCRDKGVALGIAVLPETSPTTIGRDLNKFDHCLIFSGNLGHYGGYADLSLLDKVEELKKLKPEIEIGWDGGINQANVSELVFGGIDVLNVGGFIQKADDPEKAYNILFRIADETGTT